MSIFCLSKVSVERLPGFGSFASASPCLAGIVVLPPARREPTPRRDRGQSMRWVISQAAVSVSVAHSPLTHKVVYTYTLPAKRDFLSVEMPEREDSE